MDPVAPAGSGQKVLVPAPRAVSSVMQHMAAIYETLYCLVSNLALFHFPAFPQRGDCLGALRRR